FKAWVAGSNPAALTKIFQELSRRWYARPYMYQSLISVKKVGSAWELQIKGTDDRALIVLDNGFRVVKTTKQVSCKE
ncbi:MAG: hypothetical protein WB683_14635, partial [Candidatus Sulfotelmatobacter sp.]